MEGKIIKNFIQSRMDVLEDDLNDALRKQLEELAEREKVEVTQEDLMIAREVFFRG